MTIIIDTREQLPYLFTRYPDVTIVNQGSKTGDYTLAGHEDKIIVERKTAQDFLASITSGRDRFEREMKRLTLIPHKFVVVEGTLTSVLKTAEDRGMYSPRCISGTVVSWYMKYGVQFLFLKNRDTAEDVVYQIFSNYLKNINQGKPGKKRVPQEVLS